MPVRFRKIDRIPLDFPCLHPDSPSQRSQHALVENLLLHSPSSESFQGNVRQNQKSYTKGRPYRQTAPPLRNRLQNQYQTFALERLCLSPVPCRLLTKGVGSQSIHKNP